MDKHIIHKDKGETFKCHFKIDGAEIKDTVVRLCLEFSNNKNLFFNGVLKDNGDCVVEIPRLKELDEKDGKLTIEAIADSIYFKLYEADVEIKKSIEISMVQAPITQETAPQSANIELEEISQEVKPKREKILRESKKRTPNEWQPLEPEDEQYSKVEAKEESSKDSKFTSLRDYLGKKSSRPT